MIRIITLSVALLSFNGFHLQAQPKSIEHVILIGIDGLGGYAFEKADTPNLEKLMQKGAYTLHARAVLPSSSAVNWASMLMGAGPELHGFTEWGSQTPELPSRVLTEEKLFPSIFYLMGEQKPESETGVIYTWDGIGYLFEKNMVDVDANMPTDSATTQKAVDYIAQKQPNLLFIHFSDVDGVGHNIGHDTPEIYEQIHTTDAYIGRIIKAIESAGMMDNSLILVSSDHGGIGKGHGGKTLQEVEIPWIMAGPGVKAGYEIKESIVTYDTAATIAWIFGLETPQVWTGRSVTDAFKD